jgi:hypothetical protein
VSTPLSHNVLGDLTSRPAGNEAVAFSQLRTSLIKVLRNSPESREPICDALELIEALQQQMEAKRNPEGTEEPAGRRASRGKGEGQSAAQQQAYFVQETGEGEFLTERRPSGAQPFRCPRDAYEAAAQVLAAAGEPVHFEELLEGLNREMGERQADYRLRVCLRFWLARGLVERFRTRYRAKEAGGFVERAMGEWQKARGA